MGAQRFCPYRRGESGKRTGPFLLSGVRQRWPRLVLRPREGTQSGGKSGMALPAPRRGPVARPPPKAARASPRPSQRSQDQTRIGAKLLGAPERIRTSGLWLRRPTLYPPELQARVKKSTDLHDARQATPDLRYSSARRSGSET